MVNFRGALIRDLQARGHEVLAVAPDMDQATRKELRALGARPISIEFDRTGMNPLADLRMLRSLRRLLRRRRPDLLITSTAKPNVFGALAARLEGIESVAMVTGLGYAFTRTTEGSRGARLQQRLAQFAATGLFRLSTRFNTRVVFQNPDDADEFVRSGCLRDPGKIVITDGSGVDVDAFASAPLPSAPVVLMVSRLLGNKGVREYAAAAAIVKRERPDVSFRLVGYVDVGPDGVRPREIEAWQRQGLEYLGPRNDVRPEIRESSLCVLPSYREGTPRAVLEAMSMGRPIVTCDVPGCRETVEDGENGYLVPPRDPALLADRIVRLVSDGDARRRMGERSRAIAVDRYEVGRVNERLICELGLAA